ncbi:protein kinase domain-containing protein [Streptomyces sp. NBC_01089]|uniref:serine/threonine-protein kinase n=1 Tax=Streptomyces sp. NBC_01089 TaxID=2903747 RepID=UPI00386FF37C
MEPLSSDDPREISGYQLRGRLGAGGMGSVYLSHTRGGQPVALKIIRREFAENPEFRRRFAREVAAARRVQGAYTAAVLDSDTEGDQPWLASAYVPGPSLADAVQRHGPLPARTVLLLAAGVAEALQSVHTAGVIHRDLKPSNVLLASDGPRVIDFGIARAGDATALTGTDVLLGTPGYMAPEQVEGRTAGPAVDVFTLGLVIHFAATSAHPFGEGAGHALLYRIVAQDPDLSACPGSLRPIVEQCLAKDPDLRPSPESLIEECRRAAEAQGADLARGEGWWLPRPVAAEATRRETAAVPAPPDVRPYTPTEVSPGPAPADSPAGASPGPEAKKTPRGGRARVIGAVVGAMILVTAGVLWANNPFDSGGSGNSGGSGGGPGKGGSHDTSSVPLTVKSENNAFTLQAARYTTSSYVDAGICRHITDVNTLATSVFINLDTLEYDSEHVDTTDAKAPSGYTLRYTDCSDGSYGEEGTRGGAGPTSGLKLLDGRGTWGVTKDRDISANDCRKVARSGNLPNPVSIAHIRKGDLLRTGTGICVQTRSGTVDLLWILQVNQDSDNDGLSAYVTNTTQWAPATGR